ncbi:MAG: hypothetical protein MI806_03810 [Minwuiales bacterium]|nr:hypothetical protein [Minwuiales bacterium]
MSAEELRVDGSSKEAYARSIRAMQDSLAPEDREAFDKGLIDLAITRFYPEAVARNRELIHYLQPALDAAPTTLHGVTRAEILARGRAAIAGGDTR